MLRLMWLKIRATEMELKQWRGVATAEGLGFSEWVRARLDSEPLHTVQKISTPEVERRTVRRGASVVKKIADVTHSTIRATAVLDCGHEPADGSLGVKYCKKWGCKNYENRR